MDVNAYVLLVDAPMVVEALRLVDGHSSVHRIDEEEFLVMGVYRLSAVVNDVCLQLAEF